VLPGCGPNLKTADGTRVSLREFDGVNIKSVEVDPSVPYPGLPRHLSTAIHSKLYLSKMWADPGYGYGLFGAVPRHEASRMADLRVAILAARYPSKAARVLVGAANSMRCRMEVLDPRSGTLLGSTEVPASKGPVTHGALGGGVTGVLVKLATDMPEMYDLMLNDAMAGAIVKVLDRAKKYQPPSQPAPKTASPP